MKFKEWIKCDKCKTPHKNLKKYGGEFVCWKCWVKNAIIIGWWWRKQDGN